MPAVKNPKKTMGIRLDPELQTRIRLYAAQTDTKIQDVVVEALKAFLPRKKKAVEGEA